MLVRRSLGLRPTVAVSHRPGATVAAVVARVVVVVVVFGALVVLAWWLERRRRVDAPPRPAGAVPVQLDRADFSRPDAPWLVVLFTSTACESCEGLYDKTKPLESSDVAVVECEFPQARALHDRYRIDAAPMTLIADAEGVVRASFLGAFQAADLWNALAELRG